MGPAQGGAAGEERPAAQIHTTGAWLCRLAHFATIQRSPHLWFAGPVLGRTMDATAACRVQAFVPNSCAMRWRANSQKRDGCMQASAAGAPVQHSRRRAARAVAAAAAAGAAASSSTSPAAPVPILPEVPAGIKNVVVLGGTGRVGSSTAAALAAAVPGARLSLAGRSGDGEAFRSAVARRSELAAAAPLRCDIDDPTSLAAALKGADLVIHAAGPFQRRNDCAVLEAAIAAGVPYMDVCDDADYSQRAKALHSKAAAAGVPCITTAGIYPGGCCRSGCG